MTSTSDLFQQQASQSLNRPLAERCRPRRLEQVVGHDAVLGPDGFLSKNLRGGHIPSLILWGPPGVGKTTLARILAGEVGLEMIELSATSSGVKDVKEVIGRARQKFSFHQKATLLFIDEIHRFNKAQQDALLHATEQGIIILIGATTENPSFEVNSALLSRCRVLPLQTLQKEDLQKIIERALKEDPVLKQRKIKISGLEALLFLGGGDARKTLNLLEAACNMMPPGEEMDITAALIEDAASGLTLPYDKKSDYHYDTISAFIKSVRGSDPDAAVYWLARMLDAGEDPLFIARRLIILASEDVGNAEPYALSLANAAFDAVKKTGMPEARIMLAQATTYLAAVPKSNAAYLAIDAALAEVKKSGALPVPLHLRNAPTRLMKELDYGAGYKYPHDFSNHFADQAYLPQELSGKRFYKPSASGREARLKEWLAKLWPRKGEQDA